MSLTHLFCSLVPKPLRNDENLAENDIPNGKIYKLQMKNRVMSVPVMSIDT